MWGQRVDSQPKKIFKSFKESFFKAGALLKLKEHSVSHILFWLRPSDLAVAVAKINKIVVIRFNFLWNKCVVVNIWGKQNLSTIEKGSNCKSGYNKSLHS